MKGIADLLDSDMEDSRNFVDENSILSSASDATSKAGSKAVKRGKKRHRVTMPPKQKSKVTKATSTTAKKPAKQPTAAKRRALEEQFNEQDRSDDEVVDESKPEQPPAGPTRKKAVQELEKPKKDKKAAAVVDPTEDEMEVDQSPAVVRSKHSARRSTKDAPKPASKPIAAAKAKGRTAQTIRQAIPEAQPYEEDVEGETDAAVPAKIVSRSNSRSRQEPPYRRRAGSASDTERGDPNLRRKLGDMTQKFETVDLKYRNLKEVGINEANANMEKLRKQCDATMSASNELIASLKKELALQAPLAQEARKLKKYMQTQESEMAKLKDAATELATALTVAQNEIKSLTAKLAAARTTSNNIGARTPGSAIKSTAARPGLTNNMDAAQAAQLAQMKEDLYSDLTGLIIRGVKRTEEGDTYDCIQTGRNGTLQFKLFMDSEDARTTSFDETEFLYTPLLDAHRDREMIELMPTYLTEDITFARQNAAKFYGRVIESLTKRRPEE